MADESSASGGVERSAGISANPDSASAIPSESTDVVDVLTPPPRRFGLWKILVPVLIVVIALLACDILRGRIPQNKAFEQVNAKLPVDQSSDSQALGLGGGRQAAEDKPAIVSPDAIHQLLGRKPDLAEKRQIQNEEQFVPALVETYEFPGIIKNYNVVVIYVEDGSSKDKVKPMALKYVRKQQ